ncbi:DUF6308 family protein [Corynebacterium doosanense]|uniref:Uncharacterized protein n=1 Tax=Corynebacterium doosanense CAU 212 = DSM 45436 TaxID=558173 RepID=A0A097IHD8_9CORY|nr:DUF6308 family protein [Corynebacterium doosanense]AIT61546.1 hypothetical protein CDOO_09895 [Corynebacterium doosanense CAU 212 = DSM 45436]
MKLIDDHEKAVELLTAYTGRLEARFDRLVEDPSTDRFTADDLMAAYLHGGRGFTRQVVADLLYSDTYAELLAEVGDDTHLFKAKKKQVTAALELFEALQELPGVGPATAAKLVARKRPKLFPVGVAGADEVWELREALAADADQVSAMKKARKDAGMPKSVTPLRVVEILNART